METKLKRLLKIRRISQKKLYHMICKNNETPIGLDALSQIINGKKLNYHLNTLVKICKTLKVQPHSVVESEILHEQLKKKHLKKLEERINSYYKRPEGDKTIETDKNPQNT